MKPMTLLPLFLAGVLLLACDPPAVTEKAKASEEASGEEELAPYMGQFQRYTDKLGYSVLAKNKDLAKFYVHEVEEIAAELIEKVPHHDGVPIGSSVRTILSPRIELLEKALEADDWAKAQERYTGLVQGCNACHVATKHAFIEILPASGNSPYNQKF